MVFEIIMLVIRSSEFCIVGLRVSDNDYFRDLGRRFSSTMRFDLRLRSFNVFEGFDFFFRFPPRPSHFSYLHYGHSSNRLVLGLL